MLARAECVVYFRCIARLRAKRAEIMLAHDRIVRQQDTRPKRNESAINHVKIKLVLV